MSDQALDWVIGNLATHPSTNTTPLIWCTDENALNAIPSLPHTNVRLFTNRWDIAEQARLHALTTEFSDFDFSALQESTIAGFFYRISKEKPLVHHILNHAWRCLMVEGTLYLAGFKNDGIKTYVEKIAQRMGCEKAISKQGQIYTAKLVKKAPFHAEQQLDTNDYSRARPIATDSGLLLVSKPGLFGWNKIDAGSELLIGELPKVLANLPSPRSALDLGCGYGYLTVAAAGAAGTASIEQWILTDNNAGALALAAQNLANNHIRGDVVAGDAGSTIRDKVDLILCNPPFHQGFSLDADLTDKFLASAKRLLGPNGLALFVVNQFIPLERKAAPLFRRVEKLLDNGSFKVICLRH